MKEPKGGESAGFIGQIWVMLTLQKVIAPPTKLINWTIVPPAS